MKKSLRVITIDLILSLMGFALSTSAQQSVTGSIGTINHASPKFGFNTNGYMPVNVPAGYLGANWTQQAFIDSTAYLNPEVLRYPGGTNANHWDWQTGWYRPGYQPPFPALMIRAEEFQPGLVAANAQGLYVLNMETSNVSYEMNFLRHLDSLGMTPSMIELGNEHNLSNSTYPLQLMTSIAYAQLAKTYYDSIKVILPAAKVCVVGGNSSPCPNWHTDILAQNPAIDAFAWHAYLNANNTDLAFHVNRALAEAFAGVSHSGSLPNRFQQGGFNTLPASKEIWVTEYNLWETQVSSAPVIAGTWTHLLYLTALHQYYLSNPKVTMILNHSLGCIDSWHEAISRNDHHITASGIAMKLLCDVSKGSQTCEDITFSGNPSMTYGSTTIPKLTGWKFNFSGMEKGFICNFSSDTFKVALSAVFTHTMQFDEYFADTALVVNGLSNVSKYTGNSSYTLVIYPFSFTQINSAPANGIQVQQANNENNGLWVYPNPAKNDITIKANYSLVHAEIKLFNSAGQEIKTIQPVPGDTFSISTGELSRGIYFVTIKNSGRMMTAKFVVG